MITINEHYLKLQASYLFSDIAKRVATFQKNNPEKNIIKLGIGDVTKGLTPATCSIPMAATAMVRAMSKMSSRAPVLRWNT